MRPVIPVIRIFTCSPPPRVADVDRCSTLPKRVDSVSQECQGHKLLAEAAVLHSCEWCTI
jgi:hypothetical protein